VTAGLAAFSASALAQPQVQPVLAELFTSQGCSSCPPADQIWGEIQKRPDVVALSFNIDYWDYIGWRDTLASHDNTVRQQAYEKAMPSKQMYTPQAVIDGVKDVVGNQRSRVVGTIDARLAETRGKRLGISLVQSGQDIVVKIDAAAARTDTVPSATVWVAHTASSRNVQVTSGENTGKTVTYWNVVRDFSAAGKWNGEALSLTVPARARNPGDITDGVAVWVQTGGSGTVLGAAQLRLTPTK
jgi:hypothetical protein